MNAAPFSNPTTSRDAARSVAHDLSRLEQLVRDEIFLWDGLTCEECEDKLSLQHTTTSARIRSLVLKGKIEDSGETRPTRSGRRAIIWRIVTTAPRQMDFLGA